MLPKLKKVSREPLPPRSAANPGFHEAVAGLASLSAGTSGHLRGVGLAKKDVDPVTNLNDLFHRALTHLVYMPYAYAVDRFKWDVFSSAVREGHLNCHWVKLRLDAQGEGEKAAMGSANTS